MATKNYTTKTASLRVTNADIRNLDVKKINLDGKNILDYISESEFDSYDTRDPQLKNDELDIWNTEISLSEEGHIEVKPHVHSVLGDLETGEITLEGITESQVNTLKTAAKVIDGEVLGSNDEHIMYWQTDGLTNDAQMFFYTENLTTFSSDLSNLTNSFGMFQNCISLTTFNGDLSSLTNVYLMFQNCVNLASFTSDLSNLMDGLGMFNNCISLTSFTSDLSNLMNGLSMFDSCDNLVTFTSNLSNLTNGEGMFRSCGNLTSFNADLSSLTNGQSMFYECNLTSFSSNLSSLTTGTYMFCDCTSLTSFNADLSSLTDCIGMFEFCKLDAQSVANIVHTLPTHETGGTIDIGIGCDNTEVDQLLFAQECHCDTWQELLDDFSAKNWTVTFQCNGRPAEAATYNLRRGTTLPIYAKLVEVIMPTDENEHKPHYAYTSQDGTKFYNIHYFHSTNGSTEGYDVFSSLEEAISSYNVTPKN